MIYKRVNELHLNTTEIVTFEDLVLAIEKINKDHGSDKKSLLNSKIVFTDFKPEPIEINDLVNNILRGRNQHNLIDFEEKIDTNEIDLNI